MFFFLLLLLLFLEGKLRTLGMDHMSLQGKGNVPIIRSYHREVERDILPHGLPEVLVSDNSAEFKRTVEESLKRMEGQGMGTQFCSRNQWLPGVVLEREGGVMVQWSTAVELLLGKRPWTWLDLLKPSSYTAERVKLQQKLVPCVSCRRCSVREELYTW